MSRKLPLEVQRNFSVKDQDDHWVLKCIVCSQSWQLKKPAKGKPVHGGNVLHLLEHTASHPLPKEEEKEELVKLEDEVEVVVEEVKPKLASVLPMKRVEERVERRGFVSAERVSSLPKAERVVELVEAPPISHETETPLFHYSMPTKKNPNAYKVEISKNATKVSNFRDPAYANFRQVQKSDAGYVVVLYAANPKHAALVAGRLIEQYKSANK